MGVFYAMKAPAFVEDLPIDEEYWETVDRNWTYIEDLYWEGAFTCWATAGCYMFTFTLSIIMFFVNKMF